MKKLLSAISIAFLFLTYSVNASHIAGGEITYTSLGNNQFRIYLNLFVDCAGFNPGASQTINFTSTCGGSATANVQVTPNTQNGLEISQLCPNQMPQSKCNGGNLPGMWLFRYEGTVTLSPVCNTWKMGWTTCCRNSAITNLSSGGSASYYIEATLNSVNDPINNSPQFNAQPIPYVCVNQPVSYSYGVVEPDGDSLVYQLISALTTSSTSQAPYNNPYSGTSPIPGIVINSQTGQINFTPTTIGNFVVVIKVTEYDRATKLVVGTVMRDIQFVVLSCTNIVPDPNSGSITNLTGNAVQTGPYSIEMCAGDSFNFTATFTDANAGDSLSFVSNILAALPGATITNTGTSDNPLTLNISWTAPAGSQGTNPTFTITISDNACPIMGQQTYVYYVNILHATVAGPDQTICGSQTAQLSASGGSIFNWSVISGPAISPTNFSCNPCANPVASPTATTTYQVTSNLSGTCKNIDTVTVFVVPDYTFNITQSSSNSCLLTPVQLGVTNLQPAGAYTYSWTPATNLNNGTISNPIATFSTPGNYTIVLTITSPQGCVKKDSVTIVVAPAVQPTITAFSDTTFCIGGTATLGLNFTNSQAPATCGLSATGGCNGTGSAINVGTGTSTNSSTQFPAPYSNYYKNARHQFLYTAAELVAAGVVAGKIDQLDFNVTAINGTTSYKNYTILMGCTNVNNLSSGWQTGLVQVYNPKTHTVTTGWNTHTFDNAFLWDGISNVVVEICFDNRTDPSFTNNSSSPYTTTTFISALFYRSDSQPACGTTSAPSTSSNRPNVRFHNCNVIANPANYSYQWTPASGNIANSIAQNTTAQPTTTTTYTVTVTDIAGGCTATDTVNVTVINITSVTVTPVNPMCVNDPSITLVHSAPAGLGSWSGNGITNAATGTFDPSVAGAGTHQIIFTINAACGNAADTINIIVTPLPDATITPVAPLCVFSPSIILTAATTGGTWSGTGITNAATGTFDPAIAGIGTHTITYNIASPCASMDTLIITVITQANATITQAGPFCAANNPVTLVAATTGGTWSGTGITNSTTGVFDPSVAGPGNHTISYTITGLCGAMDTIIIRVVPSPTINFTADKTSGCEPLTINFTSTNDQPGGNCFWNFGDGNTSTNCNPTHIYMTTGNYTVTFIYTNVLGCSDTVINNNYITVYPQPAAGYHASPQPTTIVAPTVQFTDATIGGPVNTWFWDFGSQGTSGLQNPTVTYPEIGTYPFQLIVTTIHGCSDTIDGVINIDPIATFYAPNAFTPNNNGLNDEFLVYADGIDRSTFEMLIYNRWGELIFKSNNIYNGWNGRKNNSGDMVESDVYVWKVKFLDFSGKENNHIGHVTLVK